MPRNLRRLLSTQWWSDTQTPRWVLVAGAVLTLCANFVVTNVSDDIKRSKDTRAQQVTSFLDSMVEFQVYASAFSTELFADGRVSTETRSRLIQNLNEQYGRISTLRRVIPEEDAMELDAYQQSVLKMNEAIARTDSVDTMKSFWSAASDLLVARNQLTEQLQTRI